MSTLLARSVSSAVTRTNDLEEIHATPQYVTTGVSVINIDDDISLGPCGPHGTGQRHEWGYLGQSSELNNYSGYFVQSVCTAWVL